MFRRRIIINTQRKESQLVVRAALEDDFHHFRVELICGNQTILHLKADSPRRPYTLCADASGELDALLGKPLFNAAHEVTRLTDPTAQCTHQFELAGLAIAAASRGILQRQYDIEVPARVDGRTHVQLFRDGLPLLAWHVNGAVIDGPPPYCGVNLYQGMARWALNTLSLDEAEAAIILRRCANIAKGREKNLDIQIHALNNGNCYSQQPQRAESALRIIGSTLDFTDFPDRLCAHDHVWLGFDEAIGAGIAAPTISSANP